jgi:hypothetical protein
MKNWMIFICVLGQILTLCPGFCQAATLAGQAQGVFIHDKSVSEDEFQHSLSELHGLDLVSWMHHQASLQNIEELSIDERPDSLRLAVQAMLARPLFPQDIPVLLELIERLNPKTTNPLWLQLAQNLKNQPTGPTSNPAEANLESGCKAEFLVDGVWSYFPEKGIHQWNLVSNCSQAITLLGTAKDFEVAKAQVKNLDAHKNQELPLWGLKIQVLSQADTHSIAGQSQSSVPKEGRSRKWLWIGLAAAAVVIGVTAYQMRDKDVSLNFANFSF